MHELMTVEYLGKYNKPTPETTVQHLSGEWSNSSWQGLPTCNMQQADIEATQ